MIFRTFNNLSLVVLGNFLLWDRDTYHKDEHANFDRTFNNLSLGVWGNFLLWDRYTSHKDEYANFDHPTFKANSLIKLMKLLTINTLIFCNLPY